MPTVSVNILTWNAGKYIKPCLESVFGQTYEDVEINIYDNGSEDDTVARVQEIIKKSDKEINFWQGDKNIGFASGHNELLRKSKGEYVLFLNQDALLAPDYIERAVKKMEKDENIAALQPKILRYDHKIQSSEGILDSTGLCILRNRRIVNRGQTEKDKGQYEKGEIFGADGAVPFYRRDALEDVKLPLRDKEGEFEYLDENFFAYKEDVDLAWRLRLRGWKAIYCPNIKAFHSRESGNSASRGWLEILKERRSISTFSKKLSFRNQRLMQIKNELPQLFLHDFFPILKKELLTFGYTFIFEPKVFWGGLWGVFKNLKRARKKRKIVMKKDRKSVV